MRVKKVKKNFKIRLHDAYGAINGCIYKVMFWNDSRSLISERMVKRIYKQLDAYLQDNGIRIVVKQITTKPEILNVKSGYSL
jgi:hypothetical protein